MLKYRGYEIYAVNTLGKWYGMVYRDGQLVFETLGYEVRDFAIAVAKLGADDRWAVQNS